MTEEALLDLLLPVITTRLHTQKGGCKQGGGRSPFMPAKSQGGPSEFLSKGLVPQMTLSDLLCTWSFSASNRTVSRF